MSIIVKEKIENINDIDFELDKEIDSFDITKPVDKKSNHYVNNKQLYEEFVKYHKEKIDWIESGKEGNPPIKSNIIANAILQTARYSANRHMFVRYTNSWKEELIGNAIEKCVKNSHMFDPYRLNSEGKKPSPFSFLTQVCDNAFKEQLKKEKKELYKKYKMIDRFESFYGELDDNVNEDDLEHYEDVSYDDRLKFIADFEARLEQKKLERKQKIQMGKEELVDLFERDEEFYNDSDDEDIDLDEDSTDY